MYLFTSKISLKKEKEKRPFIYLLLLIFGAIMNDRKYLYSPGFIWSNITNTIMLLLGTSLEKKKPVIHFFFKATCNSILMLNEKVFKFKISHKVDISLQ